MLKKDVTQKKMLFCVSGVCQQEGWGASQNVPDKDCHGDDGLAEVAGRAAEARRVVSRLGREG